jgi:hypothetical protein
VGSVLERSNAFEQAEHVVAVGSVVRAAGGNGGIDLGHGCVFRVPQSLAAIRGE